MRRIITITMPGRKLIVPIVFMALLAAFFLPVVFVGYSAWKRAETEYVARDYVRAAESFGRAARLLPWRGELWERAGVAAAQGGDSLLALGAFARAPALTEEGWVWLATAHLSLGDSTSALAALGRGLQVYDSADLYELLAFAYRARKDWQAERSALRNQIRLEPGDAYANYRLGLLSMILEPEQALTHLMFAASLAPEVDSAVQTLRAALNLSATQPDASRQMTTIGRALGLVQEWELALAAFQNAIALDEKNAEAWAWLGEAKQQVGRGGLVELDKALRLDHSSVVVRGLRALYWSRQEKYEQMRAEYSLAALSEPDNPAWQAGLGDAHLKSGDLVSALAAYQRAAELAPNESTYLALLAVFCADNQVYLDEVGLPAAQRAVGISPDDPSALDALGWVHFASGRYASAEKTLLDATSRFPEYFPAQIHLAMTHLAQGNQPAALAALTYIQSADSGGAYGDMASEMLQQYFP